jgi:GNAT superfamily N-acetyltransferase
VQVILFLLMTIAIRPIADRDAEAWARLYTGYRTFYNEAEDPAIVENAWNWILGKEHGLFGLVAVDESDAPIALANLRWFARPDDGDFALYLDDLFTAPEARGAGAASALLRQAAAIAADHGATVVRWITAADNATARHLYDAHATATHWVTYDMKAAPLDQR